MNNRSSPNKNRKLPLRIFRGIIPIILFIFSILSLAHPSPVFLPRDEETAEIINIYARNQQFKCRILSTYKTLKENGQTILEIKTSGKGAFYKYKNAQIVVECRILLEGGFFKPLLTNIEVVNLDDQHTLTKQTRFDYEKKKIFVTSFDEKSKESRKYTFRIKGPTTDYAALFCFLKPYITQLAKGKIQHFYLLSFEPNMYGVNLEFVKNEVLNLSGGKRNSIKIRLIADFVKEGDEIFDKIIPPAFVWYQDQPPYTWLKYQGTESGDPSPNIIAYLKF